MSAMTQHSISVRSTTVHPKLNNLTLMNMATSGIGPKNFFGDDLGDLVEKTKAEMQRRKVME